MPPPVPPARRTARSGNKGRRLDSAQARAAPLAGLAVFKVSLRYSQIGAWQAEFRTKEAAIRSHAAAPRAAFRQHTSPRRAARGSGCFKVRLAVQPNRRMAGRVSNEGSSDSVRTAIQTQAFTQHCSAESPAAYLAASSAFTQMEHFRSQTSRRSLFWLLASLPRPLRRE